jgi:hypothetical protein
MVSQAQALLNRRNTDHSLVLDWLRRSLSATKRQQRVELSPTLTELGTSDWQGGLAASCSQPTQVPAMHALADHHGRALTALNRWYCQAAFRWSFLSADLCVTQCVASYMFGYADYF